MTTITIDELKRMAALNMVSLPSLLDAEADEEAIALGLGSQPPAVVDRQSAARLNDVIRSARALARRRSPEETAALERWLEERED